MLLTETIRKTTSAIQRKRTAQENKQSVEAYVKALAQLDSAGKSLESTLSCAAAMKEKGIVQYPLITEQTRDELKECITDCGVGLQNGSLNTTTVKILKTKSDAVAEQIQLVWKDASVKYADGPKGYLSMIGSLTDDPQRAKELADNISTMTSGPLSIDALNGLVADVAEAKRITQAFSLNQEIEEFLKKVSLQQATIADLTPNILSWLQEKKLTGKLKVKF